MSKKTTKQPAKRKVFATHVTTPTGERVYIHAKSKEELAQKVLEAKMNIGMGVNLADKTLFRDYATSWAEIYKKPKLRESSYAGLCSNLDLHIFPVLGDMKLRDIKPIHIQKFLTSISKYSKSVQDHCFQTVKAILRTAADNGLIVKSPVMSDDKASGKETTEKEPLTNEQARALLDAVAGTPAYLFCLIALSTGMRRGEIVGLMWEDVDLANNIITVTHQKAFLPGKQDAPVTTMLKTEAAHRRLPISPMLHDALTEALAESNGSPYVLHLANGESLPRPALQKLWYLVESRTASEDRPLGTEARQGARHPYTVSLDFHCTPHILRHTFITQMFEAGLDIKQVQHLAGHAKPEMTLRIYTHYREKMREKDTAQQVRDAMGYLTAPAPGLTAASAKE